MVSKQELLPAADRISQTWRNGGGITFPVAAEPESADAGSEFDWRVSIAEISADGAFSEFPGVDRQITIVAGGVDLTIDGVHSPLRPGQVIAFRGESAVSSQLIDGPTLDLNLMTRRDRVHGKLTVAQIAGRAMVVEPRASTTIVVALAGTIRSDNVILSSLDAIQLGTDAIRLTAAEESRIAVIEISRTA